MEVRYTVYNRRKFDDNRSIRVDSFPDTCPLCHYSLQADPITANMHERFLQIVFWCPREDCGSFFIGIYTHNDYITNFRLLVPSKHKPTEFGDEIKGVSPSFIEIYNQSLRAEKSEMILIAGVGYRKALEFLIKDFLIAYLDHPREEITKKHLGPCINDYIDDENIKNVAKRAAWLGNDEAHYDRKWEDKDISDLKKLIDATVFWMSHYILTQKMISEMPGPK